MKIDVYGREHYLDLLRDEVIEYATRMLQARISVDFRVIAGAPHGFDLVT